MSDSFGRSLELFFIDDKPDGMLTAELFNWTGHVLMTPRTRIKAALARTESAHTGVYILLGENEDDGTPMAYIGEGENIGNRIATHDQKKDWWTQAILISTGANTLNKAHVKYLESRLVELARQIQRRELENGNTPPRPGLSEAARANMEAFLANLLLILPALRVDMFQEFAKALRPVPTAGTCSTENDAPIFELILKKHSLYAQATLIGGEFIVLKDSNARSQWVGKGTDQSSYAKLHQELRKTGVLAEQGQHCVFTTDYAFRSTSAAAAVIKGRSSNGTTSWKVEGTSQTYKEWEKQQLAVATGETETL
jgi:hypothetical protein